MTTLDADKLDWLEALAAAVKLNGTGIATPASDAFIAACDPDTIRRLVAMARSASGEAAAREFVESITAPADLDAAWAEAEAALPEGWRPIALCAGDDDWTLWQAGTASPAFFDGETDADTEHADGFGSTPAAALRALTEALRKPVTA